MFNALALSALVMGIVGGPHCVAMCGAACAGFNKAGGTGGHLQFLAGRLMGYAALGAIASVLVGSMAWLSTHTALFHPLWTFFHALVLAWGLVLMFFGRQPLWVQNSGRFLWRYVQKLSQKRGGLFITGILWALMPCGLLYSAVLIASLTTSPLYGAFNMLMFALGSSLSLLIAPALWLKLGQANPYFTEITGMRIAGTLLIGASGWAIWMDVMHNTKIWCAV